jgi:hypothetical protein
MKRVVTTSALAALLMTSCGAAHYNVKAVTGYVPAQDDAGASCATPLLVPAAPSDSVWARCEWWQSGALLKRDSTRTARAVWLSFAPPTDVPSATQVEARLFLRDIGGTSCTGTMPQTPTQTLIKPAAFSGLAVVP